jgi:hypothetical protein
MGKLRERGWRTGDTVITAVVTGIATIVVALISRCPAPPVVSEKTPAPVPVQLTSQTPAPRPGIVTVWGHVLNAGGPAASPIANARVTLQPPSGRRDDFTDSSGKFRFDLPESDAAAEFPLQVSAEGFQPQVRRVVPGDRDEKFLLQGKAENGRKIFLTDLKPRAISGSMDRGPDHLLGMFPSPQAGGSVEYEVPDGMTVFRGHVRLARSEGGPCMGNANARILTDGEIVSVFNVRPSDDFPYDIPVKGIKVLRLEVDDAGQPDPCDRILWTLAGFQ